MCDPILGSKQSRYMNSFDLHTCIVLLQGRIRAVFVRYSKVKVNPKLTLTAKKIN